MSVRLIDLFCGCGGFSLGAHQAGFDVVAAFDVDPNLTYSFSHNFPGTKLFLRDLSEVGGRELIKAAGGVIDGIFGGPPCQGFSDMGRRVLDDPRRELLAHFFRLVSEVEPSFFVMENVRGLAYSDARHLLDNGLKLVADRYTVLGPRVWDAAEFGAATRRQRLFVIGMHKDRADALTMADIQSSLAKATTVKAAIGDLAGAVRVGEQDRYDVWRFGGAGRPSKYAAALRSGTGRFTGHDQTLHSPHVVARFRTLAPGAIDPVGRHPKLAWSGQCPVLRAGTGADRGSYQSVRPVHPDQPRVITIREAARLQGFPDCHLFHPTTWHSFRMIGNSVSPVMARAIFSSIAAKFGGASPLPMAAE